MEGIWSKRIKEVLDNPNKAKLGALMYYVIAQHLLQCRHKRTCPEQALMNEVYFYLEMVNKEAKSAEQNIS